MSDAARQILVLTKTDEEPGGLGHVCPTAAADRGRHPGWPRLNVGASGPGGVTERQVAGRTSPHLHGE
jgi:hypothetical protein